MWTLIIGVAGIASISLATVPGFKDRNACVSAMTQMTTQPRNYATCISLETGEVIKSTKETP